MSGLQINWGQILGQLIGEIIKILTPWVKEALEELIEWAYDTVENWAEKMKDKPDSTTKMEKAVALIQVMEPKISGPEARVLLEVKHLETAKA